MLIKYYIKRSIQMIVKYIPKKKVYANIVTLGQNELLRGKLALITGGTSGIGKAIAEAFLNAGADIIITGRNEKKLATTISYLSNIAPQSNCYGFVMDSSKVLEIKSVFTIISNKFCNKKINILVNNAGISIPASNNIEEDEYNFDQVIDTNLKGTYYLTKLMAQYMIKNNIKGNILNIISTSGNRPATNSYSLSKWGIKGMTLGFAKQLIKEGIVVNGIAPGPTLTPMMKNDNDSNIYLPNNPSKRYALPEEIANISVVLTSELGRMIVGDIIYMGGGSGIITVDDIKY